MPHYTRPVASFVRTRQFFIPIVASTAGSVSNARCRATSDQHALSSEHYNINKDSKDQDQPVELRNWEHKDGDSKTPAGVQG